MPRNLLNRLHDEAACTFGSMIYMRFVALMAVSILPAAAVAQPGTLSFETKPYILDSGRHSYAGSGDQPELAFTHTITLPGLTLLRIQFGQCELGQRSYISITARGDGGWQMLDHHSLPIWSNKSAYFNGDTLEVELYVGAGDRDVSFEITSVTVPILIDGPGSGGGEPRTLCGSDDRVASTDQRVGRLNMNCTAWFCLNTAFLAAGHCGVTGGGTVEFHVPLSMSNGIPVAAAPDDQYPTLAGTISFENNGTGQDWSVFGVGPNSNTGLLPWQAQAAFFRVTRETPNLGNTIRITGCGLDHTPAGAGGFCCHRDDNGNCLWTDCNSRSKTLQTGTGAFGAGTGTSHMYFADTEPANSGSPIIWDADGRAIGIHTTGSCGGIIGNQGTSFERSPLINALENFLGSNAVYVDSANPSGNGSVFDPYSSVASASVLAPSGARLCFTRGSYAGGATFVRPATLVAPIGVAVLGQ